MCSTPMGGRAAERSLQPLLLNKCPQSDIRGIPKTLLRGLCDFRIPGGRVRRRTRQHASDAVNFVRSTSGCRGHRRPIVVRFARVRGLGGSCKSGYAALRQQHERLQHRQHVFQDSGRARLLPSRFAIRCPMFLAAQQELRPPK